jgi:hypothetical protein
MTRLTGALGYTAAVATLLAALLTPFVLIGGFTRGVAALGLRVDPVYLGGREARVVSRDGYAIAVNEIVRPAGLWPQAGPFVQLTWSPASKLPAHVADEVDVDGDGRADVLMSFDVPRDAGAELSADAVARSPMVATVRLAGHAFDAMIVRVGDRIVVRLPVTR